MRQFYTYKIVWEGNQNDFRFYTNIDYQIFLNRLLSFLHIPKENSKEYKLRIGKHDLLTSYRFPINGISEKIYLLSVKSTFLERKNRYLGGIDSRPIPISGVDGFYLCSI